MTLRLVMTFGNALNLLYHHGSFKDFIHWCRIEESAANGKVMPEPEPSHML